MATLLKVGIDRIMRVFYTRRNEKIHLRELARDTNMYGQSISRYLAELEKKKILKSEKEANLKQYSLMQNQEVYVILAQFDVEKLQRLPLLRKQAIITYLHSLPKQPIFAIVFGSTAKETQKDESDIDMLLITQTKIDTRAAEKEADALHAIKISTFQMDFRHFKKELRLKEDKVVQSALATGYPVQNHIFFYEVLAHERT